MTTHDDVHRVRVNRAHDKPPVQRTAEDWRLVASGAFRDPHAEQMALLTEIRDLLKAAAEPLAREHERRKQAGEDELLRIRAALAHEQGDEAVDRLMDEVLGRERA